MSIISYCEAIREGIAQEMLCDDNVVVIGEDIGLYGGKFGVTKGLKERFGDRRIIETPISETAFTSAAVGASLLGLRPVVEIMFGDFITLTADPIINHAAKYHFMSAGAVKCPLVLRTSFGSGTGAAAQHSQSLESMYLNTPGIKVVAPSDPYSAKGLIRSAIRDDTPVMFFEHKLLYSIEEEVPEDDYFVPIGKAEIAIEGDSISLISYSYATKLCIKAAELLKREGINAEVIDLRSLKPLDNDTIIASCEKTKRALIIHEAPVFAGFGAQIAAVINESSIASKMIKPPIRLGGLEIPVPFAGHLEKAITPNVEKIIQEVKKIMDIEAK